MIGGSRVGDYKLLKNQNSGQIDHLAGNSQITNLSSIVDNAHQYSTSLDEGPSFLVNAEDSVNHETREVGNSDITEEIHGYIDIRNHHNSTQVLGTKAKPILRNNSIANHAIPIKGKNQGRVRGYNNTPV